ncbi:PAS domain S-box-containing protein [Actinoplanes octamycinicus]|uniref:histidine kinase n=1 Tax=Actinoplanes octamycinicus TaxID=135948 RepID=A0A7W7H1K9_9ACTN|nr:PAS domain S-box protein [Actinoplanes octamycinicus]MBB4742303.1 PAS domain S-box-containing protein [Actinoplanes octamycinicus]GIE59852.1 hypothetical protein Aoc01nite_52540 [Actinoplanes octamycinicus]
MSVGLLGRLDELPVELFADSPVPKVLVGLAGARAGRLVEVNRAFAGLLGYERSELVGRTLLTVTHPDDRDAGAVLLRLADGEQSSWQGQRRFVRKDGLTVWGLVTISVLRSASGAPLELLVELVDVSADRRNQELLDVLIAASPDLLALTTLDGTVVRVNAAWERILGWSEAELAGTKLAALRHPDDVDDVRDAVAEAVAGSRIPVAGRRWRYRGRDGGYRWVQWTGAVAAEHQLIVATGRDVTDTVAAERAAARDADRLRITIGVQREITAVAQDRDAVLRLMADRTLQVLPAGDAATVQTVDRDSGVLRVIAGTGRLPEHPVPPLPLTGSLAGLAVTSDTTLRCDDAATDPRVSRALARDTGTGSLVVAPLRAPGSAPFGVLMVGSARPGAFDDGDEQLLTLLADALGAALRHAEDSAQRLELLRCARAAARDLERERSRFAEVFDNSPVAKLVVGLRDADRGVIRLANPAFCELFGYSAAEAAGLHLADLARLDRAAELEQALSTLASGVRRRGQRETELRRRDGSIVAVAARTSVITDEHGPASAVIQLLDITADRAAQRAADRERDRLTTTLAVQREVIAAAADRDAAMRVVAHRAVPLFAAADGAVVELLDGDELRYAACAGTLARFTGTHVPAAGSLSGSVVATGTPAHCADTGTDPRINGALCKALGIGSMLIAPLHAGRTVIGVLKVSATRPGAFDDTDEQQLALLADSLSSALRHADDAARNAALLAERTQALADLEVTEKRFRMIFDHSPIGVTLASMQPADLGRYLQVNPAMTAITGYSADELTGMTFADLQHPDDVAGTQGMVQRLWDGEIDSLATERRYRHKDGHTIWAAVRVAVVRDDRGRARYVVNQVEDITARRAAEIQLRQQARLLELIPAAVIVRDLDGTIRWWNAGATQLYGWAPTAAAGKVTHRLFSTIFPDGESGDTQRRALAETGHWSGQLRHVTATGRLVTVLSDQVMHHPEPDTGGAHPPQILEINTDVTAARAAEQALADSEQRLRAQFTNSAAGQVIRALDGTLIDANPAYAGMLGYTVAQLAGITEQDLLDPAELPENRRRVAGLFAGDADSYTRQGRLKHADGHWVDVEATVSLVRDHEGRPQHLIGVVTDISARRAAERARDAAAAALAERNAELEAANQLKLDIIGMLGHEIGNPLTTILGNADLLADGSPALSEEQRGRAVEAIARQADRLDGIVREVLALVTIEAGTIRADRGELAVRDAVGEALAAVGRDDLPIEGPDAIVLFHPGHLQQILVNLLSNAAKYGGGATAVRLAHTTVEGEPGLDITVEDSGPGVPDEFRDRLFDRLTRADRDATTVRGTGLGLYIVRGLAQANHGDIRYEPNPAGGSRFVLRMHRAAPYLTDQSTEF